LPVVVVVIIIIIDTVRVISFSVPLVIFFSTVTRGFGARVTANHNLRNVHNFGLIKLGFSTRRFA
jgi:hypothetical protein